MVADTQQPRVNPRVVDISSSPIDVAACKRDLKGEDTFCTSVKAVGVEPITFAVVADGHGGPAAAQAAAERVIPLIIKAAKGDASAESLRQAGTKAFAVLHDDVREACATDGTTLTVCMINQVRQEATTVHVGDSAAILVPLAVKGLPPPAPVRLTAEHRLQESQREQKRVRAAGGIINRLQHPVTKEAAGPLRAFPGGVACARAIGDGDVGRLISAVPASSTVPLRGFACGWDLLVASDGVWDALSATAVVKLIRNAASTAGSQALATLLVEQSVHARHAFNNAGFQIPRDDTTCIFLRCRPPPDAAPLSQRSGGCNLGSCELPSLVAEAVQLDASFVKDEVEVGDDDRTPPSDGGSVGRGRSPRQMDVVQHDPVVPLS